MNAKNNLDYVLSLSRRILYNQIMNNKDNRRQVNKCWGGRRACAGRKRTCKRKVPFNRRINEDVLKILRVYSEKHNITETEALESAIILQNNIDKLNGEKIMKIVIPSANNKLCGHFGNCEYFSFVEADKETKSIINIENKIPEEGISCQSANWISAQGANIVLAGGMGNRPMQIFQQNGVQVITGCPEIEIEAVVRQYLDGNITKGENPCGGEHHHCHGHNDEGHHHCHHNNK